MNPFPDLILSPTTAHRIPSTSSTVEFIHKLLSHEVNVYAFLMDEDLLLHARIKGFQNDPARALSDLIAQLPRHIRDAVFPPPPPEPEAEPDEDEDFDEGKDSPPPVKGFSLKISDGYSIAFLLPKFLQSLLLLKKSNLPPNPFLLLASKIHKIPKRSKDQGSVWRCESMSLFLFCDERRRNAQLNN